MCNQLCYKKQIYVFIYSIHLFGIRKKSKIKAYNVLQVTRTCRIFCGQKMNVRRFPDITEKMWFIFTVCQVHFKYSRKTAQLSKIYSVTYITHIKLCRHQWLTSKRGMLDTKMQLSEAPSEYKCKKKKQLCNSQWHLINITCMRNIWIFVLVICTKISFLMIILYIGCQSVPI